MARDQKPPASNGRLRGGKGSLHEGGVRVPTIVNWPARLAAAEVAEPLHRVTVMPTLLGLAGASACEEHPLDGRDMWPTLAAGAPSPKSTMAGCCMNGRR